MPNEAIQYLCALYTVLQELRTAKVTYRYFLVIWNSLSLRVLPLESCVHIVATSHSASVHISRGPEAGNRQYGSYSSEVGGRNSRKFPFLEFHKEFQESHRDLGIPKCQWYSQESQVLVMIAGPAAQQWRLEREQGSVNHVAETCSRYVDNYCRYTRRTTQLRTRRSVSMSSDRSSIYTTIYIISEGQSYIESSILEGSV